MVPSDSLILAIARLVRRRVRLREAIAWCAVLGSSLYLAVGGGWQLIAWPYDWGVLSQIPDRLQSDTLYSFDTTYNYVWSPAMAAILAAVFVPLGYWAWFALHAIVLAVLRDRRLIALGLLSLSLWIDAGLGNTVTFAVVAGILALRGNRGGELASLALFALVPRPLLLPLLVWLLWHRRHLRIPFLLISGSVIGSAAAAGLLDDWVLAAAGLSITAMSGPGNFGPTSLVGPYWFGLAVPAAIILTVRGHVGMAGLMLSPYLYPQYLLALLLDVHERRRSDTRPGRFQRRGDDRMELAPQLGAAAS